MKWTIFITLTGLLMGCVMPYQQNKTSQRTPMLPNPKKVVRHCVHKTTNAISQNTIPIVNLMADQDNQNA